MPCETKFHQPPAKEKVRSAKKLPVLEQLSVKNDWDDWSEKDLRSYCGDLKLKNFKDAKRHKLEKMLNEAGASAMTAKSPREEAKK